MMNDIIRELREYEKNAINYYILASNLRVKIMEEYGLEKDIIKDIEIVQIPFAAYETQLERFQEEKKEILDRNDAEKDKMRRHYRNILNAVCAVLAVLIIGIFGTILYFFSTFEVATLYQDISTGNHGDATIEDGIHYDPKE